MAAFKRILKPLGWCPIFFFLGLRAGVFGAAAEVQPLSAGFIQKEEVALGQTVWMIRDNTSRIINLALRFPVDFSLPEAPFLASLAALRLFSDLQNPYGLRATASYEAPDLVLYVRFPSEYLRQAMALLKRVLQAARHRPSETGGNFYHPFAEDALLARVLLSEGIPPESLLLAGGASPASFALGDFLKQTLQAGTAHVAVVGNIDGAPYLLDRIADLLESLEAGQSPREPALRLFDGLRSPWRTQVSEALKTPFVLSPEAFQKDFKAYSRQKQAVFVLRRPWKAESFLLFFLGSSPLAAEDYPKWLLWSEILKDYMDSEAVEKVHSFGGILQSFIERGIDRRALHISVRAAAAAPVAEITAFMEKTLLAFFHTPPKEAAFKEAQQRLLGRLAMAYRSNGQAALTLSRRSRDFGDGAYDINLMAQIAATTFSEENLFIKSRADVIMKEARMAIILP